MPTDPTMLQGNLNFRALRVLPQLLVWHFRDHPIRIVHTYMEYALAFRESFSILFLLKTVFAPWKSIKDSYPQKGLNVQAIFETLFLNLTTRTIGAIIRLSAIIAGLVIQIALVAGFLLYLIWWMLFPFVLLFLPFYLILAFFL
jgi:hypothetical protein